MVGSFAEGESSRDRRQGRVLTSGRRRTAMAGGAAGRRGGGARLRDDQGRLLLQRSGATERRPSGQGSEVPGGGSLLRDGTTAGEHERRRLEARPEQKRRGVAEVTQAPTT
ncbi:hypothetical protein E2562_024777 [Oryza meyeriana var. granulata]|uniref:Uncharacterized protein n=1 Tax=Oryza meyeriana var. granulata TaxID=110450 RepID=A0A6G1E281_9ORYZ|nr:hypothetical protein E2562_024777 [Oryza meyeriana var. granulata]